MVFSCVHTLFRYITNIFENQIHYTKFSNPRRFINFFYGGGFYKMIQENSLWIRIGFAKMRIQDSHFCESMRIHIIVGHNLRIRIRIESGFANPDSQRIQGFA